LEIGVNMADRNSLLQDMLNQLPSPVQTPYVSSPFLVGVRSFLDTYKDALYKKQQLALAEKQIENDKKKLEIQTMEHNLQNYNTMLGIKEKEQTIADKKLENTRNKNFITNIALPELKTKGFVPQTLVDSDLPFATIEKLYNTMKTTDRMVEIAKLKQKKTEDGGYTPIDAKRISEGIDKDKRNVKLSLYNKLSNPAQRVVLNQTQGDEAKISLNDFVNTSLEVPSQVKATLDKAIDEQYITYPESLYLKDIKILDVLNDTIKYFSKKQAEVLGKTQQGSQSTETEENEDYYILD